VRTLQTDYLMLAALPSAVGSARRYARRMLADWGLAAMTDDVEIVVSELVTNAVKASGGAEARPPWSRLHERLEVIYLSMSATVEDTVIVEVWDGEAAPPVELEAEADAESGRGLKLVGALSLRWGTRWPSGGGKIVWSECACRRDPCPGGLPAGPPRPER
jgi:anti-sigma regulatory factor (Ser/Thr protein kinase)